MRNSVTLKLLTKTKKGGRNTALHFERKKAMKNFFAAKREAETRNKNQKTEDGRTWKVVDVRGTWQVRLQYHINKLAAKA
jgi:hypothetical protein